MLNREGRSFRAHLFSFGPILFVCAQRTPSFCTKSARRYASHREGGGGGIMIAQCDTASLIEKTGLFRAHVFSLEPLSYTYLSPFRSTGTAHKTCISVYNAKKLCPLNWECSLTKQMSGDGQPKGERASVKGED